MFGLLAKGFKSVAAGRAQADLGIQSPHLPAAITRIGRFLYSFSIGWIGITWYTGYANMRTAPHGGPKLWLPGMKPEKGATGKPDRPEHTPKFLATLSSGGGSGGQMLPASATGGVNPSGSVAGHPELKAGISAVVATVMAKFNHLQITSTTSGGHASGSYHYLGRAADLAGPGMDGIGAWIAQNLASKLTEGIHNPTLSVKDGKTVPPSFWGASTWAGHTNHIHLAV